VFNEGGKFVRWIGRQGEGPGEFQALSQISLRGNEIFAFDRTLGRTSVFSTDGSFLKQYNAPVSVPDVREMMPIGDDRLLVRSLVLDRSDRVNLPQWSMLTVLSIEGDSLHQFMSEPNSSGKMIRVGNRGRVAQKFFYARSSVSYFEGFGILRSNSTDPTLNWYDLEGNHLRSIHLEMTPELVTDEERTGIRRYLQLVASNVNPSWREANEEANKHIEIPEVKAFWSSVSVDGFGYHWISCHPDYTTDDPRLNSPRFQLLSPEGEYLGIVQYPESESWLSRGQVLAHRENDETGENVYLIYRMVPIPDGFKYP